NMKYEDHWSNVRMGTSVRNWYHDTMLWAHIFDNRPGTTSLKFNVYVHFGIMSYEEDDSPFLRTTRDGTSSSGNSLNRIKDLLKEYKGKEQLLRYNALDSIYEFRLALHQHKMLKE